MAHEVKRRVMIIAGEASGDLHGAHLVKAMRRRDPFIRFYGIGGGALEEAGVKILFESSRLSVVGITEVFSKLPEIRKGLNAAKNFLKNQLPDLLILIDFPDFNFIVAAAARKLGIPVLYYISPQIWAWRQGRVRRMKRIVDHVAVILPFEEHFYKAYRVPVTYVGHPLLDSVSHLPVQSVGKARKKEGFTVGLLPGSRKSEITRHLPVMLEAADILNQRLTNVRFIVPVAPSIKKEFIEEIINNKALRARVSIDSGGAAAVLKQCDMVTVASGTVTLEAAIAGTPMLIIYKMSPVSYWIGRALISVKTIGLVNLIAGKKIVPELIQNAAEPEAIADIVFDMLQDTKRLAKIRSELHEARQKLGRGGASDRTAKIAVRMLR